MMRVWRIFCAISTSAAVQLALLLAGPVHGEPVVFPLVHPLAGADDVRVPYDRGYGGVQGEEVVGVPGGWHGRWVKINAIGRQPLLYFPPLPDPSTLSSSATSSPKFGKLKKNRPLLNKCLICLFYR
jgi:hypothetical protein